MPPLPTIAGVYRAAVHWRLGGQIAVNVMHYRRDGGFAAGAEEDLAQNMNTHTQTNMFKSMSTDAHVEFVTIQALDGASAAQEFDLPLWDGSGAGTEFTPALSCIVSLKTALAGKEHRGRIYLPYTAEAFAGGGTSSAADADAVETAWRTYRDQFPLDAPPWEMVVASYKLATADEVTAIHVRAELGTQRRRQSRLRNP